MVSKRRWLGADRSMVAAAYRYGAGGTHTTCCACDKQLSAVPPAFCERGYAKIRWSVG